MNKLRKNIILVLIVSLILSVNYAAFAESSESKDLALNMDEATEEKTTETIATNDATEQDENKDESKEEVITVDEQTEKDQDDESEAIDESETEEQEDIEEIEDTEVEIEQEEKQEEKESNEKDKETKETDEKSDIKEKDENVAKDEDKLQANLNKETEETENTESKNTIKLDGEQDVTNWSEFKEAYKSEDVHTITFKNDITYEKSGEVLLKDRGTSLTIEGNGKILDTDTVLSLPSTLFTLTNSEDLERKTFTINDLKIKHGEGQVFYSEKSRYGWELSLNNIQNEDTKPALSSGSGIKEIKLSGEKFNWESDTYFIQNANANVFINNIGNIEGEDDSRNKIISNKTTIKAKNLTIDNSKLEIMNMQKEDVGSPENARIIHLIGSDLIIDNSDVKMESSTNDSTVIGTAIWIESSGADILFKINKSEVDIKSKSYTYKTDQIANAVVDLRSNGIMEITDGSNVSINSEDAGQVLIVRATREFSIKAEGKQTVLNLTQSNEKQAGQENFKGRPVLKYYNNTSNLENTNSVISTTGAEINIISSEQFDAETVSLQGGNNYFSAQKGGKMTILNPSNKRNINNSGDRNQAIKIESGNNTHANKFSSMDVGSEFIIESKQGKAIEDFSFSQNTHPINIIRDLQISVTDEASFIARGNVANVVGWPWSAIMNGVVSGTRLSVDVEDAAFYDFANTVEGGGLVFNPSKSTNSTYKSSGTGLSLWELGKNIDGKPDKSWNAIDFTFGGKNFSKLNAPDENENNPSNIEQHEQLKTYIEETDKNHGKLGLASFSRISNMSTADILKIDANDLFISRKGFQGITNESELANKMGAEIYVNDESSTTYKISTNHGDLDFESPKLEHAYNITFSIEGYEEIKVTKKLVILDYDHVTQTDKYVVAANDFSIWDYDAAIITNDDILKRSDAKGWEVEDWPTTIKQVEVSEHNVEGVARDEPYNAKIVIKKD